MSFDIIATEPFERKTKRLTKKYQSFKTDLARVIDELALNPYAGTPLGKNCYKIRMAIASKAKGKSSGARIITCVRVLNNTVYLIDIFDKSEQENISDKELMGYINLLATD